MRRFTFLTILVAALGSAGPALASPPSPSLGTFAVTGVTSSTASQAGGNMFITQTRTGVLTGTFSGTTTDEFFLVIHADGSTTFRGVITCACVADGRVGTLTVRFEGTGDLATNSGRYTLLHGTGGLEDVHGNGPFQTASTGVTTYEGQHHFDPDS